VQVVWQELLKSLGPMLAGDLGKANTPAILGPNSVVIRFPSAYNRQYVTCAESGRQQKIQDTLRRITGESWTLRLEVAPDLQPARSESTSLASPPAKDPVATTDPMIEAIKSSLDARVMRVDDGFGQTATPEAGDDEAAWTATEEE
jgi:DNA polymerase III subunit gamma/tau